MFIPHKSALDYQHTMDSSLPKPKMLNCHLITIYSLLVVSILIGGFSLVKQNIDTHTRWDVQNPDDALQIHAEDAHIRLRRSGKQSNNKSRKTDYRFKGVVAIHLEPQHNDNQYESGQQVPTHNNGSNTRDLVYRFWHKASWVQKDVAKFFYLDEATGHVTVEMEGIYLVYAQIVYHDLSGRWSFGIYVGGKEKTKCLATEQLKDLHSYHPTNHGVFQSCYTSTVTHIRKNQGVSIHCMYGTRTILTSPMFTYWGIIKLS